jgi:hypothetical protein
MAWCLNCDARIAPLVKECPGCQAAYDDGQGWRPLPESEAEEEAQSRERPLWSDAFTGGELPPHLKVTRNAECVRVAEVYEQKGMREVLPVMLPLMLGMAFGAAVAASRIPKDGPVWFKWVVWGLPLLPLVLALLPASTKRKEWTIFSSGEVFEVNGRREQAHKVGTPVSILLEPFDRSGGYAPPPQSLEARLVARGPLGFAVIRHDSPWALRALRDEMRGQRPAAPTRDSKGAE